MEGFFGSIPFLIFVIYVVSSIISAVGKVLKLDSDKQQGTGKRQKPVQAPAKGPFGEPWWGGPWESPFPWEPQQATVKPKKRKKLAEVVVSSESVNESAVETPVLDSEKFAADFRKGVAALFSQDGMGQVTIGFESGEGVSMQGDPDWEFDMPDDYDDWGVHSTHKPNWLRSVFMDKENVVRGIILSEVLGHPKSRQ
jgi:hypothetical protein